MKGIYRIIPEIITVSILAIFITNGLSQERKLETPLYDQQRSSPSDLIKAKDVLVGIETPGWSPKSLAQIDARSILETYWKAGYAKGAPYFPVIGYDVRLKKLIPLTTYLQFPLSQKPIAGNELASLFASFRDSVSYSHNDLEDRVRRLENKVAQIEKECCD